MPYSTIVGCAVRLLPRGDEATSRTNTRGDDDDEDAFGVWKTSERMLLVEDGDGDAVLHAMGACVQAPELFG